MKKQNLYNVTVYATLSKDVLVYAENEDAALNYVQDVCDNTDLISFDGREILDVTAEDVEEIDPFDGFEGGDGGDSSDAENRGNGSGSIRIVGRANGGSATNGEEAANRRKMTEGCKCSGEACASCCKCEKRGAPTLSSPSAGKEAEALRKLTELLGGPFVDILID